MYFLGDVHAESPLMRDFLNSEEKYCLQLGDFGFIFKYNDWKWNRFLNHFAKNYPNKMIFTVLGNHENYDRLNGYPVKNWNNGLVHEIRPSVFHLMRGQVFDIAGKKIFSFGGAACHDVDGGILDTEDPDFADKKKAADRSWLPYRIKHISWWKEELPDDREYDEASKNLEAVDFKIDYIISHCCSSKTQNMLSSDGEYVTNALTDFFDLVREKCEFKKWYFGHYHDNKQVNQQNVLLYEDIVPLEYESIF